MVFCVLNQSLNLAELCTFKRSLEDLSLNMQALLFLENECVLKSQIGKVAEIKPRKMRLPFTRAKCV